MSGGSHNYIYCSIDEELVDKMKDLEMNDMMRDLVKVAHDLEWWDSCDTSEENYRKTVSNFKKKWFGNRDERLKKYIDDECNRIRLELTQLVGDNKG